MSESFTTRPKPGENEEDLLRMQEDFEQSEQKPSAKILKKSKFAQSKDNSKKVISTSTGSGEVLNPSTKTEFKNSNENKIIDAVNNIPSMPSNIILGNIVERKFNDKYEFTMSSNTSQTGFPQVFTLSEKKKSNLSLFLQNISKTLSDNTDQQSKTGSNVSQSVVVQGPWAKEIHESNVQKLNEMSVDEILAEKAKLEQSFSPDILEFLKSRRKRTLEENKITTDSKELKNNIEEVKVRKLDESQKEEKMDADNDQELKVTELPKHLKELFAEAKEKCWVHMDAPEPEKLEWTKDINTDENSKDNPDEPYNARFDFDGLLLPYKDDSVTPDKGLHHHGEEPERPGYSLQELIMLSRSATQQQRITALTTLANIMAKSRRGWYDKVLQPAPLATLSEKNILLLLRFSLDEPALPIITATLRALREFLFSEADEICLDRLFGLIDGFQEPSLAPDMSDVENINELKDDQLAQIDTVAAAMRTDIVLRIRYILSEMRPTPVGVNAALDILIRLARRSRETALNIATIPNLLCTIITNFLPVSANQLVNPESKTNAYGRPIVAALRLCRVLITYAGRPVADRLQNLGIISILVSYVATDAKQTGLELQIESLRLWKLLLQFNVEPDSVSGSSLVLVSQLGLLLSNLDLNTASELTCEYAGALILVAVYEKSLTSNITLLLKKWSTQLTTLATPTWARTKLIAQTILALQDISAMQMSWISNQKIFDNLRSSSNLLSGFTLSSNRDPSSLPSLGVLAENGELQPAVSLDSCAPLLLVVLSFMLKSSPHQEQEIAQILENMTVYLRNLVKYEWSLERSWYTHTELLLLTKVVLAQKLVNFRTNTSIRDTIWKLSLELVSALPGDRPEEVKAILEYAFSHEKFQTDLVTGQLQSLEIECGSEIHLPSNFCKSYEAFLSAKGSWTNPAMPRDWLYLPIVNIYTRTRDIQSQARITDVDIANVKVLLSLESCVPQLTIGLSPNLRFSRLCLVFLCEDIYRDSSITPLFVNVISNFLNTYYKKLDFSAAVPGLNSFTDLFISLCESFVAYSFGDDHFTMALLTFLAQRHDVHYRKSLWSEHAGALRYCAITPEKLYYPLTEFLYPLETDVSLIECYITALVRKTIRVNWCPVLHMVAMHHAAMFLKQTADLPRRMRAAVEKLSDRELARSLLDYQPLM